MNNIEFNAAIEYLLKLWPRWKLNDEQRATLCRTVQNIEFNDLCGAAQRVYSANGSNLVAAPWSRILEYARPRTSENLDNRPSMSPSEYAAYCQRIRDEDAEQDAILAPFTEEQLRTMVSEAAKMEFVNKAGENVKPFGWLAKVVGGTPAMGIGRINQLAKPSGQCNLTERLARDAAEWFQRGAHAEELPDLEAYRLELAIKAQNRKQDGSPTPQVA